MIRLQYHPQLIEEAVRLRARQDAAIETELHSVIDPIYETFDGEEREAQFRRTFAEWFSRLRFDRYLNEALMHFPRIVEVVRDGFVRPASRPKWEGAELYIRREDPGAPGPVKTVVVQLCSEALVDPQYRRDGILRELQHVEDMLDERFGYAPDAIDGLPSRQQVIRDRYRLLWDIRVEAILDRQNLLQDCNPSGLWHLFERAFTVGGSRPDRRRFEDLWRKPTLTHLAMFSLAQNPRPWLKGLADSDTNPVPGVPGEPCPICGFPTFDWYDARGEGAASLARNVAQCRPDWKPSDGICRQCAETLAGAVVA